MIKKVGYKQVKVDKIDKETSYIINLNDEIIYCRDCKWWKDSDGKYKRGAGAESKCLMNTKVVYEGNGYCYMAERG